MKSLEIRVWIFHALKILKLDLGAEKVMKTSCILSNVVPKNQVRLNDFCNIISHYLSIYLSIKNELEGQKL